MSKFDMEFPQDVFAEGAVIGSIVFDRAVIPEVLECITAEDFLTPEAKQIYSIVIELWQNKQPIDGVIVRDKFPQTEATELFEYLQKALQTVPSAANALYYAKIVRRKSIERKLYSLTDAICKNTQDPTLSLEEKLENINSAVMNCPVVEDDKKITKIGDLITQYLNDLNENGGGLTTGFSRLDRLTNSFANGQLILIAGRPSIGKSSLALDMFIHAVKIRARPYLYSLEMSATETIERLLKNIARVEKLFYRTDAAVIEAGNLISKNPAWIEDEPNYKIDKLFLQVLAQKEKNDIGVCFVDYLQLVEGKGKSLYEQTTNISRQLKLLAKKADIPVVALCQLNRACELRNDHRPMLSDLRDSGSLEQDADIIIFLHRDDYYRKKEDPDAAEDGKAACIVAKNRRGRTGDVNLVWLPQYFSFGQEIEDEGWPL